ncbi:endothelin-converting enzyme homolog isoform X2 [Halichondria panicea]
MDEETHPIVSSQDRYSKQPTSICSKYSLSTVLLGVGILLLGIALLFVSVAFGVTVATSQQGSGGNPTVDDVCVTPSCVKLAASILSSMNESVNPCQDFYNFTCGGWDDDNIVPPGYPRYSTFDQLGDRNIVALKKILDRGQDDGVEAVKKVIYFYQSCLNLTGIEMLGVGPLQDLINRTGGWSLLLGNDSFWDINNAPFLAEKVYSSPAFFTMDVGIDDKNSSNHILEFQQSGLTLSSPSAYTDNRTGSLNLAALKTFIVSTLSLIQPSGNTTLFEEAADGIIEFETSLATLFYSNVDLRDIDKTYNLLKVNELSKLWPYFRWEDFVAEMMDNVKVNVSMDETVIMRTPYYFSNLTKLYNSTEQSVLENYAKWQLIRSYIPYLSDNFVNVYYAFTKTTQGSGEQQRYKTCIGVVQDLLPIALARPYSKYVLPQGTKGNVSMVVDNIKSAFKERLDANTWLDATTKEKCKDKVDAITKQVAYPDQLFDDNYLNGLYQNYNISAETYFDNFLLSSKEVLFDNLQLLRGPVDKTMWLNAPTAVNAYYDPQFNGFVFLEGILNIPFFDAGWPFYSTYGALGVVVGHELTHGFDDQGQRYDKDGILEPWWSSDSVKAFDQRKECFVEQYSKYEVFGYQINGSLTLGENIADNGGIKSAFQAHKDVVTKNQLKEQSLPGLTKYTPEQMLFINFGQVWCSLFTPEAVSVSTKVDPHSPGPYRVIGSLVNSPEFASAFNCPTDSPMNPTDKCLMW